MKPSSHASLRVDRETVARILGDSAILQAVLAVGKAVHKLHQTDAVAEKLLAELAEMLPADRGAILLNEPVAWKPARFEIVRDIHTRVTREGEAIMVGLPTSVLCAPLRLFDLNLGAIYIESLRPNAFTERDLRLLAAIASTVALKFEDTDYIERMRNENEWLRDMAKPEHELLGNSAPIRQAREFIERVGPTDSTVLILGESGTGKEVIARSLHRLSPRAKKPYIAVNCGAFVNTLVETELFGHERGAFTGATEMRRGKIELAQGGTLFLDEIGEMPRSVQVMLLRVLQERVFHRVGGSASIEADVRVIAATNRDLKKWVEDGRFRLDLYYRLNFVDIRTAALREISEDIPVLAENFLKKYGWMRPITAISPQALDVLMRYGWPGNVRELENAIHRAVIIGKSDVIQPEDLPTDIRNGTTKKNASASYRGSKTRHGNELITRTVAEHNGNVAAAARKIGVSESYIYRILRQSNGDNSHS